MGSPGFVAPEIIMHEPHTPAMDIFSLGIVLFIMLVGRKPFNIKDIEHLAYCNMDLHDGRACRTPGEAVLRFGLLMRWTCLGAWEQHRLMLQEGW